MTHLSVKIYHIIWWIFLGWIFFQYRNIGCSQLITWPWKVRHHVNGGVHARTWRSVFRSRAARTRRWRRRHYRTARLWWTNRIEINWNIAVFEKFIVSILKLDYFLLKIQNLIVFVCFIQLSMDHLQVHFELLKLWLINYEPHDIRSDVIIQ